MTESDRELAIRLFEEAGVDLPLGLGAAHTIHYESAIKLIRLARAAGMREAASHPLLQGSGIDDALLARAEELEQGK